MKHLLVLLVLLVGAPALGQEPMVGDPPSEEAVGLPTVPPGPPPEPALIEALTHEVSSGLRCPVCQGLSVADSPSESAIQMKNRIRELVTAGYTRDQINDYFVSRYGEWVLLEPTMANNWLVWLAPGLVAGFGLAWVAAIAARWRREPEPLPSDVGLVAKDKYEERLLAEIEE